MFVPGSMISEIVKSHVPGDGLLRTKGDEGPYRKPWSSIKFFDLTLKDSQRSRQGRRPLRRRLIGHKVKNLCVSTPSTSRGLYSHEPLPSLQLHHLSLCVSRLRVCYTGSYRGVSRTFLMVNVKFLILTKVRTTHIIM